MNKQRTGLLLATGVLVLTLAGCGNHVGSQQTSESSSSTSLIAKRSRTKVSAQGMTPQQAVSLVTAYAGNRYGGQWARVAKQAWWSTSTQPIATGSVTTARGWPTR
ncbi:hypothetical protein [Limosilactobacillus pontis]|uniref:hypothetical protein n=1 Tax=Limosilactobacillus pontis TaxID=35787 RepID=UPI002F268FE1